MSDDRTPSLSSFFPERKPCVPRSTTKAEIPFLPLLRSVTAITTAVSATRPLVMNVFDPLSTQESPSRTAVALVPPASEPALFSVRPQQPTFSPLARGVRNLFFCSSVPARKMWPEERLWWAARERATPASTRESSSMTMAQSRVERPEPPYSGRPADPHEPQLRELAEDLAREVLLLVPFPRVGPDLRLREVADGLPQELLLLAQLEIQGCPPAIAPFGHGRQRPGGRQP